MKLPSRFRFQNLLIFSIVLLGFGTPTVPALAATTSNSRLAPCAVTGSNPAHPTKTETIGFKTITEKNATVAAGQTSTIQTGHSGKRLITYTASYKKGKLSNCKHTGTKVTLNPVNTITSVGTYVAPVVAAPVLTPKPVVTTPAPTNCTNGTYVNTAGNTVCSPEAVSTQPAGATAQCVDGTYSFSQSRSGTCSHHGGVASWL